MNPYILVVYYSRYGNVAAMAEEVARGVQSVDGIDARVRTVPAVSANTEATESSIPEQGPPYATLEDLQYCAGVAFGSPTRFGNMAAPLKYYLDKTGGLWQSGALINKPAGFFTSATSMHGGQESTLISMMLPMIHHGAIIVGVPYNESALYSTTSGGTPYGPSHFAGQDRTQEFTSDEKRICRTLGKRIASLALKLQ